MQKKRIHLLLAFVLAAFIAVVNPTAYGQESVDNADPEEALVDEQVDLEVNDSDVTSSTDDGHSHSDNSRQEENDNVSEVAGKANSSNVDKGLENTEPNIPVSPASITDSGKVQQPDTPVTGKQVEQQAPGNNRQGQTADQNSDTQAEDSSDDDPDPVSPEGKVAESGDEDGSVEPSSSQTNGDSQVTAAEESEDHSRSVEGDTGALNQDQKQEPAIGPGASTDQVSQQQTDDQEVEGEESLTHRFPSLTIGANPSERNFTWYSDSTEQGYFEYAPYNEDHDFTDGTTLEGTPSQENNTHDQLFSAGFPSLNNTQVTLTDLEEDTTYMYRFWNGDGEQSEVYAFRTHPAGDFDFLIVGDAQLGSSGDLESDIEGWQATLSSMPEVNADPNFLLSVGDQVEIAWRESEYAGFIEQDGLNEWTLVPIIGNHDTFNPAFSEHFALPNVQEEGQTEAGSNYYFTYNNALFIALNVENTNFDEHETTIQKAIDETSEQDIDWRVVTFHRSLYSSARHSDTLHTQFLRDNLSPLMNKYQIDIVLSGHDHSYARSHVMDGTNPQIEWDEDGSPLLEYTDPEGPIYLTFNSSSGSKYYSYEDKEFYDYLAVRDQQERRNFSNAVVTGDSFEVVTYNADDLTELDRVIIRKTNTDFNKTQAQRYVPEAKFLAVTQGEDFPENAGEAIKNTSFLPEDTQYSWEFTPETNVIGTFEAHVRVSYSDESSELVVVPVQIIETREAILVDPSEDDFGTLRPKEVDENNSVKVSVIADPHTLAKELILDLEAENPQASEEYLEMLKLDGKFFTQSAEVLQEAIRLIEANGSNYILIPGDLTRDAEHATYDFIVQELTAYVERGEELGQERRVFVVPGNHDINNPAARDYSNGEQVLPFYTPQDFERDFDELVYGRDSVEKYNQSDIFNEYHESVRDIVNEDYASGYLSYVDRFDIEGRDGEGGVTVLAIDSAIYSADVTEVIHPGENIREHGGIVLESLMRWLVEKAHEAHQRNDIVVAIGHHAFIPHFHNQEVLMEEFIIRNWDVPYESEDPRLNGLTPKEVFADNGIHYLFTGHMHANDIAVYTTENGNTLYDIETGSLVSYPVPVRHMEFINDIDSKNTRHQAISVMEVVSDFYYLDVDGEVKPMGNPENPEDENRYTFQDYTNENLITADFLVANAFSFIEDYFVPARQLLSNLVFNNEVAPENVVDELTTMLVGAVKGLLGTPEEPTELADIPLIGAITAYWDDNYQGGAVVGEVSSGKLYVNQAGFSGLIGDLLDEADAEVLQNPDQVKSWIETLAQEALDFVVVTEGENTYTVYDLAENSYHGHTGGEEEFPTWVQAAVNRFNTENVLFELIQHLEEPVTNIISNLLRNFNFDLGEYLGSESTSTLGSITFRILVSVVESRLPENLEDVINLAGGFVGIDDYQAFLSTWINSPFVEHLVNPYNPVIGDIVESFNNELHASYPLYAYLYDNNTEIAVQLTPVKANGQVSFLGPNAVSFEHDLTFEEIQNLQVLVDGEVVENVEKTITEIE